MTYQAKITSKGQTTVPADVRAALGLVPGDRIVYEPNADGTFTVRKRPSAADLKGIALPYVRNKAALGMSWKEIRRLAADARAADYQRKYGAPGK
jgi:AbrB family looped-hinge helix DNA binding protein